MSISLTGQQCLVTGASGFIGSHLTRLLVAEGAHVRALVRKTSRLKPLQDLPVEFVYGDIANLSDCRKAVEGVDYLFHVAGQVLFGTEDPKTLFRVNRDGVRCMLEAAFAAKVKRCVVTSSVAAIGPSRTEPPFDETTPWDESLPHSAYSHSKHEGEEEAMHWCEKGLPVVAVNPSLVIGAPDEGPSIGGKFLLQVLKRRFKAYIRLGFNCVDVEDVAKGHLLALTKGKIGERYILSERNVMLKELLDLCERFAGTPSPKVKIPYGVIWGAGVVCEGLSRMVRRPLPLTLERIRTTRHVSWYQNDKACRELGWEPKSLEETLPKTLAWLRAYYLNKKPG